VDKKKIILEFIKKEKLAVLATVGEITPESSVLEFGETDSLEIILDMFTASRKYKNMKANPNVSLVIGWDEDITIQYEGVAEELSGKEKTQHQEIYWKKNPKAKRWADREGITYFKITPKWIRYSDLNVHPWKIFEINL
jgi:general stress protein 26